MRDRPGINTNIPLKSTAKKKVNHYAMDAQQYFHTVVIMLYSLVVPLKTSMDVDRYNEGKRQFELLQYKSEMPHYGQCWIDAMATIQAGCKQLTDDTQSRLALAYLNCFLELQGLETQPCHSDMQIRDCTKSLRESDRSSFTTFFTHTQNICYFLQAQIWHQETELTISHLADRSSQVAAQLEASQRLQEDILDSQSKSLLNQDQLMEGSHTLRGIINASSNNIRILFDDLKTSTMEQRQIIGDVFDQLLNLQSTILGEVSGFYSFLFYVMSLLVSYILTSTARTSGARLWLFLVMTLNIVMEQTAMRWIVGWNADDEKLYWLQRVCRRVSMLLCVAILSVCSYMYTDINEMNNQLLTEIRKQNSDIKRFISGQGILPSPNQPGISTTAATVSTVDDSTSDSDYTSDNNDGDDSDDSDRTFILDKSSRRLNNGDEEDAESRDQSMYGDLETSSSSLMSELYDLRKSTPIRELESRISSWLNQSQSEENQSQSDSPSVGHSYNLRRRPAKPSASPYKTSPALKVESPNSFSRTVHHLHQVSEKNSRLLRAEIGCGRIQTSTGPPSPRVIQVQYSSSPSTRRSMHHQPQSSQHHLTHSGGDN